MIEMDGDLFLCREGLASELLKGEGNFQFIECAIIHFGAHKKDCILEISDAWPVVTSLNFVEISIPPFVLIARIEDAVVGGNGEVDELNSHLIDEMMIELEDEGLVNKEAVDG